MKKTRLLKFFFFFIAASFLFTACDDEEPAPSPTLVGYWDLQTIEIRNGGDLNGLYNPLFLGLLTQKLEFFDNDEFVQIFNAANGLSGEAEGNYSTNTDNTELTLQFSSEDDVYVMDLQLNQMFLTLEDQSIEIEDPEDPDAPPQQFNLDIVYRYVKLF